LGSEEYNWASITNWRQQCSSHYRHKCLYTCSLSLSSRNCFLVKQ